MRGTVYYCESLVFFLRLPRLLCHQTISWELSSDSLQCVKFDGRIKVAKDAKMGRLKDRIITKEMLLDDEFSQWAVTTPLYNVGEQVYQLSDEWKKKYPEQPWNLAAGLGHRLVHDYDGINWSIIVDVVFEDMQPFVDAVKRILEEI